MLFWGLVGTACAVELPVDEVVEKQGFGKGDDFSVLCLKLDEPADCDICEVSGWYGDGECDNFCPQHDIDDCGPPVEDNCDRYADFFGLNVPAGSADYLDDAVALGSTWLRVEVRRKFSFDHYSSVIDQAHARGRKVLLLVDYMLTPGKPAWNGSDAEWDAYRNNFRQDVQSLAAFLGHKVDAWEVWNEPDHQLSGGYDPGVPAHQFGRLLANAQAAIRPHSAAPLVIGGLATKRYGYMDAAEAAASFDYDGLGVHTYQPVTWSAATTRNEIDTVMTQWYDHVGLPLWVTEAGGVATSAAELHAANYVDLLFSRTWELHRDKVQTILYFAWSDKMGFAGERFGLLRLDGSRKPGFQRFADQSEVCPSP
jgi:hypothetical protein